MKRVIEECPICGEWDGPADGDAATGLRVVCEKCLAVIAERDAKETAEVKACPDCQKKADA